MKYWDIPTPIVAAVRIAMAQVALSPYYGPHDLRNSVFPFGAAFMKIAFEILDGPRRPRWLWRGGWLILFSAGLLIVQGTILTLTGGWLPLNLLQCYAVQFQSRKAR